MPEAREESKVDARGRPRVQTVNEEESMTIQSDAHLADMKNILAQFGAGGMQDLDEAALQFSDVSSFTDLQDAMNQAKAAEIEFMKLPSKVREIFNHDVAVWLDTAHDKEKRDALVAAGFIQKVPEDPAVVAAAAAAAAAAQAAADAAAKAAADQAAAEAMANEAGTGT